VVGGGDVGGSTASVDAREAVVLETKLATPRVRPEHVPRRDLIARLADDPRRLTLVAAPPGFGKTSLLAEWAASAPMAVAWLSLDEADNDPARFFTYLAAAVRRIEPDLAGRALAALRTQGADLIDVVLPSFINDLAALDHELVLVIEDYHVITDPEVHEGLGYLLARMPSTLRVVLSTREDPPLPLARLRARGELTEIRAADLRFDASEAATFLVDTLRLGLTDADVARIQARTEGWPAALYLAALSLRGAPDASAAIARFAGDDRYLVDYLTGEVLARQSPELRSFLLRTSILKRFSGPLCDAVLEREGSAALLAELERSNLLLVPLDSKREWYRYHHLFGDLLRQELAAVDRALLPTLHRRASAWCHDAGLIVDAADHAIAAGDVVAAGELIARHYEFFVDQGQLATVIRWLEALPERIVSEDWLLCFAAGVVYAHAGRFEDAEHWLRRAEHAPPSQRDGQEPAAPLAALSGYLQFLRGDVGASVASERRALALIPASEPALALAPQMVLGPALWWSGGQAEARSIYETLTRTGQAIGSDALVVFGLGNRAVLALEAGDDAAAAALADEAVELMRRGDVQEHPWSAMAHLAYGTVLLRRGDLDSAASEIEQGIALGERLRAWQLIAHGSLLLAEIRQRRHLPTEARRLLTRVRDILRSLADPGDGFARLERAEKALRLHASRDRGTEAPYWELSPRELEVLRRLALGRTNKEIAAELFVSEETVKTHIGKVLAKLQVENRAQAIVQALKRGLVALEELQ
jgi:LuxR family maltose regulon positive regulatory protein